MRTIKFRAWDKVKKEMWYKAKDDGVAEQSYGVDLEGNILDLCDTQYYPSIAFTKDFELTQFTGLLDKNGKEIYEGDILERTTVSTKSQRREVVIWSKRGGWQPLYSIKGEFKVVGNVYENPELNPDLLK